MRIVDFHSHFFSRTYFEALAARSPLPGGVAERLASVAEAAGIELPAGDTAAQVARWTASLDEHGVEHLVSFASVPEELPVLAEAADLAGGRITPVAFVDPRQEGAGERVRALVAERRFAGALLFPALHHYHVHGPEARPLLAALDEHGAVLWVHCGLLVVKLRDLLGLPRVQDLSFANPLDLVPAANAFPNLRFVVPHFGAGFFRETLMAGAACANVFVDTSSSNAWMQSQPWPLDLEAVLERTLEAFGAERVLFGTDSCVFPAGWRADRYEEQQSALERIGASAEDREKVLGGNARRLLGL